MDLTEKRGSLSRKKRKRVKVETFLIIFDVSRPRREGEKAGEETLDKLLRRRNLVTIWEGGISCTRTRARFEDRKSCHKRRETSLSRREA